MRASARSALTSSAVNGAICVNLCAPIWRMVIFSWAALSMSPPRRMSSAVSRRALVTRLVFFCALLIRHLLRQSLFHLYGSVGGREQPRRNKGTLQAFFQASPKIACFAPSFSKESFGGFVGFQGV